VKRPLLQCGERAYVVELSNILRKMGKFYRS